MGPLVVVRANPELGPRLLPSDCAAVQWRDMALMLVLHTQHSNFCVAAKWDKNETFPCSCGLDALLDMVTGWMDDGQDLYREAIDVRERVMRRAVEEESHPLGR